MDLGTVITRNEDRFLTNPVGDEMIILNLETGDYLGLNPVGASIWDKMKEKTTIGTIVDALVAEFDVERNLCQEQTLEYLEKMAGFGLLKMEA
jgi:hypothetical protein